MNMVLSFRFSGRNGTALSVDFPFVKGGERSVVAAQFYAGKKNQQLVVEREEILPTFPLHEIPSYLKQSRMFVKEYCPEIPWGQFKNRPVRCSIYVTGVGNPLYLWWEMRAGQRMFPHHSIPVVETCGAIQVAPLLPIDHGELQWLVLGCGPRSPILAAMFPSGGLRIKASTESRDDLPSLVRAAAVRIGREDITEAVEEFALGHARLRMMRLLSKEAA